MNCILGLRCVLCGADYAENETQTCPKCGTDEGILDVRFDIERAATTLSSESLQSRPLSIWRYRELLPIHCDPPSPLHHIGWTPVLEAPRLARSLGIGRLRLKDEGRSASGSFKDRASAIGVARAMEAGAQEVACASTGNAASSLAHCAAAVGIPCNIFVSQAVPEGKLAQLLAYGARVFRVAGSYAQAYELCRLSCDAFGWYNRNAAVNPYLVEGKKTGGLELAEQCAEDSIDWVVCSVGDGCSIAGVHKGLTEMRGMGLIDWSARILGVQASGVSPVADAFLSGNLKSTTWGETYADSINVQIPRNWRKAIHAVRDGNGAFVVVEDAQIKTAVKEVGRLAGVFAEPAAATAVAGIATARHQGILDSHSNVVAMITGNGLKDIHGAISAVGDPFDIKPQLSEVQRILENA